LQETVIVQSDNVAQAGIKDAVLWFKRQPAQPVNQRAYPTPDAAFHPRTDPNEHQSDTIDESIGIVREYPLSRVAEDFTWWGDDYLGDALQGKSRIWVRYEVRRQSPGMPWDPNAVHDISKLRIADAETGDGRVWQIGSAGYVYVKADPSKPYNVPPNKVIAKSRASTELWRINLILPSKAALIVNNISTVKIDGESIISGMNNAGIAYYTSEAGFNVSVFGSSVTGSPPTQKIDIPDNTEIDPVKIFGVTSAKLAELADISVSTLSELTNHYPAMAIVYIGSAERTVFNDVCPNDHSLVGGGILYVNGDLELQAGADVVFTGIIYVNGNVRIIGNKVITGALVAVGKVDFVGDGGKITYNDDVVSSVRQQLTQYRENKSAGHIMPGLN
jgi:hypothetical protein